MLWETPPKESIFSLVIGFQPVSFSKNELFQENFSKILSKLSEQSLNCSLQIRRSSNIPLSKVDFTKFEEMLFEKEIYKICFVVFRHIFW